MRFPFQRRPTPEKLTRLPEEIREHVNGLYDANPNIVIRAARELARVKHPEAIPHLVQALREEYDENVRYILAKALNKIGGQLLAKERKPTPQHPAYAFTHINPTDNPEGFIRLYTELQKPKYRQKPMLWWERRATRFKPFRPPAFLQKLVEAARKFEGLKVLEIDSRHLSKRARVVVNRIVLKRFKQKEATVMSTAWVIAATEAIDPQEILFFGAAAGAFSMMGHDLREETKRKFVTLHGLYKAGKLLSTAGKRKYWNQVQTFEPTHLTIGGGGKIIFLLKETRRGALARFMQLQPFKTYRYPLAPKGKTEKPNPLS